jgi:hypothetical protein
MKIIALPTSNPTSIPVFKIKGNKQLHADKNGYHGNPAEIENYALYVVDNLKGYPNEDDFIYYEGDDTHPKGIYTYILWNMIAISDKTYNIIATTDRGTDIPYAIPLDLVQAYCKNPDIVITNMALNFQWEVPKVEVDEVTYQDLFSQLFVGKRIIRYTYEDCYGRRYTTLEKREYDNLVKREILLIDNMDIGSSYEGDIINLYSDEIRMSISMNEGMGKIGFVD